MKYHPAYLTQTFLRRSGFGLIAVGKKLQAIATIVSLPLSSSDQILLSQNERFRNLHAGRRAFVVANGPSINNQDLGLLKKELTFTMSGIWKSSLIEQGWQPTYYSLGDPLFFAEEEGFDSIREFFANVRSRLKKTVCFMPLGGRNAIEKYNLLKNMEVHYTHFQGALADHPSRLKIDFTQAVPGIQSVAQLGIELALYMGCNPIYLIGFDHDWLAKRGADRHFYQGKTLSNHPKAHGDLNKFKYKDDLRDLQTLWEGYEYLQKVATARNISIINATDGGFLDVFPRTDYPAIFKKDKNQQ